MSSSRVWVSGYGDFEGRRLGAFGNAAELECTGLQIEGLLRIDRFGLTSDERKYFGVSLRQNVGNGPKLNCDTLVRLDRNSIF